MFTLFRTEVDLQEVQQSNFMFNEYFEAPVGDENILLTTRHKAWVILTEDEYNVFKNRKLQKDPYLFSLMKSLGFILSSDNLKKTATLYCKRYSYLTSPPILFIVVPTIRCNLICSYCHAKAELSCRGKGIDMSEELLYKTIDFFFSVPQSGNDIIIEFQGGEPLLRFDLISKAMNYSEKKAANAAIDCSFRITTNLTLMNDRIANEIKSRGNVKLCSSLDGPKVVHDAHRYYSNRLGSYDKVVYWLDKLYEQHGLVVGLLPTCTKKTIGFEQELVDEYLRYRNTSIFIREVADLGRAHENGYDNIGLSAAEFVEIWKNVFEYCLAKCRAGQRMIEMRAKYLLQSMLEPTTQFMCMRRPCGCGVSQIAVAQDGSIYGCDAGRSLELLKLGHVLNTSYDDLITSANARALRTLAVECLPMCESCPFGPYCGFCVARGINQHGSPIPKTPLDFECQINRAMIPYLFTKLMNREDAMILEQWVDA